MLTYRDAYHTPGVILTYVCTIAFLYQLKEIGEHMHISISESDVTRMSRVGTSSKKGSPRVVMVELSDLKVGYFIYFCQPIFYQC